MKLKNKITKFFNNPEPIVGLTAYSFNMAKLLDKYVDFILVGDSLAMTLYGMKNTQKVTVDMMIRCGESVCRAAKNTIVVIDLPRNSFEKSPIQAYETASKIIKKTGCYGVKIEGGKEISKTVSFLTKKGIPVMGHIGLSPQSISDFKKIKIKGFKKKEESKLIQDSISLSKAGVFALVIEAVAEKAAKAVAKEMMKNKEKFVPTIGIGASKYCSGQILVTDDMLGLTSKLNNKKMPKFVKTYQDDNIELSVKKFCSDVKNNIFPDINYCYSDKEKSSNNITYLKFARKK